MSGRSKLFGIKLVPHAFLSRSIKMTLLFSDELSLIGNLLRPGRTRTNTERELRGMTLNPIFVCFHAGQREGRWI